MTGDTQLALRVLWSGRDTLDNAETSVRTRVRTYGRAHQGDKQRLHDCDDDDDDDDDDDVVVVVDVHRGSAADDEMSAASAFSQNLVDHTGMHRQGVPQRPRKGSE